MMTIRTLCLGELDTNCYVVWDANGSAVVIDPADDAEQILALIEAEHLTVGAVVLTHAHFDHMLAAEKVATDTGAPLYVGVGDEGSLSDPIRNLSGVFQMCPPLQMAADKVLSEGDVLTIGEMSFTVLETPGHSEGSVCLVNGDVIFSGDTLFAGTCGRTDLPTGSWRTITTSLNMLAKLPGDYTVYPGHGPATTMEDERVGNPYMN